MAKIKSWKEKMGKPEHPEVKSLQHGFADLAENSQMLIPTPKLIEQYLNHTVAGRKVDIKQMRKDLASEYGADGTCPLTTGIFLRIVTEYTNELKESGEASENLTPVWRIVNPKAPIWNKLTFEKSWILNAQKLEGIEF